MKGRTNEEGIDPVTDKPADDASRRGELERRSFKFAEPECERFEVTSPRKEASEGV